MLVHSGSAQQVTNLRHDYSMPNECQTITGLNYFLSLFKAYMLYLLYLYLTRLKIYLRTYYIYFVFFVNTLVPHLSFCCQ